MTSKPSTPRPGRGVRVLLAVSLALNLALIGGILGKALRTDPVAEEGRGGRGPAMSFGPLGMALTPEDRRAIARSVLRDGQVRDLRATSRQAQETIATVLRTEPFDVAAMRAALTAPRARMAEVGDRATEALIERVAGMSAEDRAALADRLTEKRR